jgi:hypothetical protein
LHSALVWQMVPQRHSSRTQSCACPWGQPPAGPHAASSALAASAALVAHLRTALDSSIDRRSISEVRAMYVERRGRSNAEALCFVQRRC